MTDQREKPVQMHASELDQRRAEVQLLEATRDALWDKVADLMYAGNRLARGEATAEEWYDAVMRVTPEHAKPTVCKRENDDDLSGT